MLLKKQHTNVEILTPRLWEDEICLTGNGH